MSDAMIQTICDYFATQPVLRAWVFGSYARGEETPESDVDILVKFDHNHADIGLMRYARMMLDLSDQIGKKVDLVEDGTLLPFAERIANQYKKLIYEREDLLCGEGMENSNLNIDYLFVVKLFNFTA